MTNKSDAALRIARRFDASPERVFDALLDRELTEQSFLKSGMDACVVERDARVGGTWSITARKGDDELASSGEYLEVDRPRRLVFTFGMQQFSPNYDRISIDIAPDSDGCMLVFTQEGEDIAAELRALPPGETGGSEMGWRAMLDSVANALR